MAANRFRFGCVWIALSIIAGATADSIRFAFSGTVTQVSDPNNVLSGVISVGMPVTGSINFDPSSMNTGTSPDVGIYNQVPPLELVTNVGPFVARTVGPSETFRIEVGDNVPGSGDRYYAIGDALVSGPLPPVASALSRLTMLDATGEAFNTISLPLSPPLISAFPARSVTLRIQSFDNHVATIRSSLMTLQLSQPGGAIRGVVELQNYSGSMDLQWVTVEVRPNGSEVPIESHLVQLNSVGEYVCPTSLNGFFDIAIKGSHYLRKTHSFIFIAANGVDDVNADLLNGDVDDDNEVNLVDFAIVASSFGRALGDPGFDVRADLDGDEEINLGDVAIVAGNFGLAGDP